MNPIKTEQSNEPKLAIPILAGIFLAALAGRLYLLYTFPHVLFLHEADFQVYYYNARSILTTHGLGGISVEHPPFYSLLIVLARLVSGDLESAARLVSSFMGSLLVVPLYFLCREIAGWRTALLTTAAAASFDVFLEFSQQPITHATYLTLLMGCIAAAAATAMRPTVPRAVMVGVLCGTLYLTRPEGIIVFGYLLLVFAGVLATVRTDVPLKSRLSSYGAFCLVYLVTVAPYLIFIRVRNGQWMLSGKAKTIILGVDGGARLLADGRTVAESAGKDTGIANLMPDMATLAGNFVRGLMSFSKLVPEHLPPQLLWLALLGFVLTTAMILRLPKMERNVMLWKLAFLATGCVAVLPAFVFTGLSVVVSYILPLFPLLLFCICISFRAVELVIARFLHRQPPLSAFLTGYAPVSIILTFVLCFSFASPYVQSLASEEYRYFCAGQEFFLKDTGLWLKQNTLPDAQVMVRWGVIGHYADRRWSGLVDGDVQEVVDYAKKHGINYLVIDSNAVPRRRPKLAPLLDPATVFPGLTPVYSRLEYGILVIIYRVG